MEEEGGDQVEEDIDFWGEGSFWQNIPDDLMIHIFSFLDCNSLLEASKTCRKWRRVASDESLWRDLVSCRVGLDRTQLPDCHSWYEEYRRLCMNIPMIQSEVLKEHDDEIYHVLFSPSGKYFTTTGKDGYVVVWELGMPSKMFTMTQVVDPPSYTRFSEFNQSETKLLVSGIDMRFFYDGFIKIYQFGQDLIELCMVRVEFHNFRGAWFDDDTFLSLTRTSDETNGYFLQVRAHEAVKKICQHEFTKLIDIRHACHRNDFIRVVDKAKWTTDHEDVDEQNSVSSVSNKLKQEDVIDEAEDTCESSMKSNDGNYDRSVILYQTSRNLTCALYQYNIKSNDEEKEEFASPGTLYECDGTIIGTNVSEDHRYLVYNVRQKIPNSRYSLYNQDIEVRVHDLKNDKDTGEVYKGARSCGEENVSYIFPSISKDFISCGSEDLKGYIWDRRYGILLSELSHDHGVHSQNGVNATAFCSTDQEVLVTVADDLYVRIWRSRQRILDLKQNQVQIKSKSGKNDETFPESLKSNNKKQNNPGYESPIFEYQYTEGDIDDMEDKKVTCCYGFKKSKSEKNNKREKLGNMSV